MGMKFSNGRGSIRVMSVGQAINELKLLPGDLVMDQGENGRGSDLVLCVNPVTEQGYVQVLTGGHYSGVPERFLDDAHEDTAA